MFKQEIQNGRQASREGSRRGLLSISGSEIAARSRFRLDFEAETREHVVV